MYSWEGAHVFMGRGASLYGKGCIYSWEGALDAWEGAYLFMGRGARCMGRGASIYGKGRISHDELLLFGEPVPAGFASVDEGGQWEDVGRAGDENEGHGRKNKSDVELREKRRLRVVQC
jgi:hypothetical protein